MLRNVKHVCLHYEDGEDDHVNLERVILRLHLKNDVLWIFE